MDSRKLIQHGLSSLTISLPSHWIKEKNLSKGDLIFLREDQDKLILQTQNPRYLESCELDLSDLDRVSIVNSISQKYREGYKEIKVNFKENKSTHLRLNKTMKITTIIYEICARLIGFEVIDEEENKVILKQIISENKNEMETIFRRILLLLKNLNLNGLIEEKHREINNLSNYYLRLLNLYGYSDSKKTKHHYFIISTIEKIVDIIKYNSRFSSFNSITLSKKYLEINSKFNLLFEKYYSIYYKKNNLEIFEFSELRDKLKKEIEDNVISFSKEEIYLLSSSKQIVDLIIELVDY